MSLYELQLALSAPSLLLFLFQLLPLLLSRWSTWGKSQVLHAAGRCNRRLQKQHVGLHKVQLSWLLSHSIPVQASPVQAIPRSALPSRSSLRWSSVHMHLHWSRSGACNIFAYLPKQICTNMNLSGVSTGPGTVPGTFTHSQPFVCELSS